MSSSKAKLQRLNGVLLGLTVLFAVVWLAPSFYTLQGLASYLPLHMFAETFSIVISMLVFGVAWNVYSAERPGNVVILACALLAVGLIDFAHMLSFKGMPDFVTPSGPEKAINLWLSARLIAALALLTLALRPWQPLRNPRNRYGLLTGSLSVSAIVIWLGVVHPQEWPRTFIPGQGLTVFKIAAEYIIVVLMLIPAIVFYRRSRQPQSYDASSLFAASVVTILSELCFTLYSDVADIFNLLGHLYKIVAYVFIYRAVFLVSVREPFRRLDAEVAENQRIAKELGSASLYTRSLIEASLDPLVTISAEGKITDANKATEVATGRDRSELIGTDFSECFADPDKAREGYRQAFLKGYVSDYPLVLRHRDGHLTSMLYNASVYRNEQGEVRGVFASARDITEHRRAELARSQLAAIVESTNDAIIGKTPDGIITSWNKGAERIYGYSAAEIVGKHVTTLAPDALHGEIADFLERVRKGGTVANQETERIRKDGTRINVAITLSPIRDEFGNINGISTIARDITERKQAEEVLFAAQQIFRTLVENSPDIIARYDRDCRRTYVNPSYLKVAQIPMQELLGSGPAQRSPLPVSNAEMLQKLLRRVLDSGAAEAIDVVWPMADNVNHWYNIYAFPEFDREGTVVSVMTVSRDITERKLDEEALRRTNRELSAISNCHEILMRAEDEQTLLNDICRVVCEDAGYRMACVGYREYDEAKTVRPVAWAGVEDGYLAQAGITWADTERGHGPSGIAIRSGKSACFQDFSTDPAAAPWRASAAQRGYRSSISMPLKDESANTFGILTIYSSEVNAFTPDEIRLLEELAANLAFGITVLRTRIERRQAEAALRENEEKYRTLIQKIRVAVVVHAADTQIVISNSMAQEILGLTEDQLLGKMAIDSAWHFFREDGTAAAQDEYPVNQVIASRKALRNRILGVHRPNMENDVWALVNADPVFDEGGEISQIIITFIDITERKQVEESLKRMNERFSLATRAAHLGVWDWDLQKNKLVWDDRMYELYGVKREDFAGAYEAWLKGIHPDDREASDEISKQAQRGEREYDTEFRVVWPDGSIHYLKAYGQFMRDADGKPLRMTGVNFDITESKRMESERAENLRYFESMDKVNRAMQGAKDLEGMLGDVLDVVLDIFDCDRVGLVYPCDPHSPTWQIVMERAKPGYSTEPRRGQLPMTRMRAESMQVLLEGNGPVQFTPQDDPDLLRRDAFGIRSFMSIAVHPRIGGAWEFGIHQCAQERTWSEPEVRLFEEIGRRLADGLNIMLANRDLQESEQRYRLVFENSPVSIWEEDFSGVRTLLDGLKREGVTDLDAHFKQHPETVSQCAQLAKIIDVNAAALALRGAASKEALLEGMINTFTPESYDTFREELVCLWNGTNQMMRDAVVRTLAGELRHVTVYFAVCPGYENSLGKVIVSLVDITGRKRTEEALHHEQELLNRIMVTSPVGIALVSREGQITFANPQAEKILGLSREEITQRSYNAPEWHTTAIDGEPLPDEEQPFSRVMAARHPVFDVQHAIEWPDGRRVLLSINGAPIFDARGEIDAVAFAIEDITERKRVEDALVFVAQRGWQTIGENFFDALAQFLGEKLDMDYVLIDRIDENPEMAETVALYAKGAITPNMRYALKGTPCENVMGKSLCVYSQGIQQLFPEDTLLPGMGAESYIGIPLWDSTGRPVGLIAVMGSKPLADDAPVTQLLQLVATRAAAELERKRAEEEIRKLNQELEQRVNDRTAQLEAAIKELEAFSYSVSHDLRTPLRAIDGFSHILLEEYSAKLDEEGKRLLNVVRDNTSRMGQLIDDILKFSRAGRLEISYSEIDMEHLAYSVSVELRPVIAGDKLQLEIGKLPPARGDIAMMRQVFVNLLSNAIKFSSKKESAVIKVGGYIEGDETVYFVKDNGAGFDMQYANKLFGVFQRLHGVSEFEGTGIGLAIVKRIVTRHGGRVWAEGKVNEGATFYFSLPHVANKEATHG